MRRRSGGEIGRVMRQSGSEIGRVRRQSGNDEYRTSRHAEWLKVFFLRLWKIVQVTGTFG